MRSGGNFSPKWGYLAPAPSFARTARVVLVATAIGATAGAGVVLSLIDRPSEPEKTPVAARAIVTSVRAAAVPSVAPTAPAPTTSPATATAPAKPASPPASVAAAPPSDKPDARASSRTTPPPATSAAANAVAPTTASAALPSTAAPAAAAFGERIGIGGRPVECRRNDTGGCAGQHRYRGAGTDRAAKKSKASRLVQERSISGTRFDFQADVRLARQPVLLPEFAVDRRG